MNPDVNALLAGLLQRPVDSNKYDFGHVLVVGGSAGLAGAPLLAGLAALRTGAGLVTIASEVAASLQGRIPELMTHKLPAGDEAQAVDDLLNFMAERKVSVMLIGPGLGAPAAGFIRRLVAETTVPTILDAGALSAFQGHLDELAQNGQRNPRLIITPHAGEYQKLSGQPLPTEAKAEQSAVQQFARDHHLMVVLKGHHTLVAAANGTDVFQNRTGNPGLATAGSGDVLAGVIAGLCAQGFESFKAACAGVYLHGLAGDLAAASKTQPGLIASDLIDYLPAALTRHSSL